MTDEELSRKEIAPETSAGGWMEMERELSDQDLEWVVGGVSPEAALESFLQLTGNWNPAGS